MVSFALDKFRTAGETSRHRGTNTMIMRADEKTKYKKVTFLFDAGTERMLAAVSKKLHIARVDVVRIAIQALYEAKVEKPKP